jgi:hypothetical protein
MIEAMKLALEALEAHADIGIKSDKAITALRTAIAEAEKQEPAPGYCEHCKQYTIEEPLRAALFQDAQPLRGAMPWEQLYPQFGDATPPAAQREPAPGYCKHCKQYTIEEPLPAAQRQPLTDEQITQICVDLWSGGWRETAMRNFARAIEAAHGITGEKT